MSSSPKDKRIVIIAGPNGAGKTTFAREFLPTDAELPNFVNADLIAAGLSPFAPDVAAFKAGRIMLETIGIKGVSMSISSIHRPQGRCSFLHLRSVSPWS